LLSSGPEKLKERSSFGKRHANFCCVLREQMLSIGREIVMAIQKKSLKNGSKGSKKLNSTARGAKPKASVRGGKEISMRRGALQLPAVQ
jgi:hypothetical protein